MVEQSNIPKLEIITKQLQNEIRHGEGEIFDCLSYIHDSQKMVIVIVGRNKGQSEFKTLHMNKYARELMESKGMNPDDFDEFCLGTHPKYNCPMRKDCAAKKVWERGQYIYKRNIKGPITGCMYDVLLFPLKFNGTEAVVEFWIPQEEIDE